MAETPENIIANPSAFVAMLLAMTQQLDHLYREIIPTLRSRLKPPTEEVCQLIRVWLADAARHLEAAKQMREVCTVMTTILDESEVVSVRALMVILERLVVEITSAVNSLKDLLAQ